MPPSSTASAPDLLAGLNPAQRAAVTHHAGPLLVLAGAGSGKTRVVTHRIALRLREGLPGHHVLALTFTNKAAAEMRARVDALTGGASTSPNVGTFHATSARLLRQWAPRIGRSAHFTIYDDDDQIAAIKRVLKAQGVGEKSVKPSEVREAFDRAKNEGRLPEAGDLPPTLLAAGGAGVADAYEAELLRSNALDFGDLILRVAQLLEREPELAAQLRRRWPVVLVDEFQDTNPAQMRWLRALSPPETCPDLTVVGDDDQAIYGWRGADVRNMLAFEQTWAGASVVRLEQNYRSTAHILAAANAVVAHNTERLGKTLFTDAGEGHRVEVEAFESPRDEARWVAGRVRTLCRDEALGPGDFAVLLRTASLSLDLEEAFRAAGVPAVQVRGRSFYDRAEVRDAVAWLRLAVNPHDDVAFQRAIGAPSRGVGETSLEALSKAAAEAQLSLYSRALMPPASIKAKARGALATFSSLLDEHRALASSQTPLSQVSQTVLAPLLEAMRAQALATRDRGEELAQRVENVERLVVAIREFSREQPDAPLDVWLERVKLVSDADAVPEGTAVSMLTVHAAKGLEFPVCFVIGFEEGTFPHARALRDGEVGLDEERRLAYVAMTRARQRLTLSWCRERRTFTETRHCTPSRFIGEVPTDHIEARVEPEPSRAVARPFGGLRGRGERSTRRSSDADLYADPVYEDDTGGDSPWRVGMWVWHGDLGRGRVVGVSRGVRTTLQVEFDGVGRRSVIASWVSPYDAP